MHRSIESDDFRGDYGAKFPLISEVGHPPPPPLPRPAEAGDEHRGGAARRPRPHRGRHVRDRANLRLLVHASVSKYIFSRRNLFLYSKNCNSDSTSL